MRLAPRSIAVLSATALAFSAAAFAASTSTAQEAELQTGGLAPGGYLVLDRGADGGSKSEFVYYGPDDTAPTKAESLSSASDCVLAEAGPDIVSLSPTPSNKSVGLRDQGLGVKSRGPGENCAQIQGGEVLAISLGTDTVVDGKTIGAADLVVEVTGECTFYAQWRSDSALLGDAVLLDPNEADLSDCGPNSGANDNYRITLTAPSGATGLALSAGTDTSVRLMGGAETTEPSSIGPSTTGSVFELVESDGVLDCPDEPNGEESFYTENLGRANEVTVTRLDKGELQDNGSYLCELVDFSLDFDGTTVEFGKDLTTQPNAEFTITATYTDANVVYDGPTREIDYNYDGDYETMVWCNGSATAPALPGDQVPPAPPVGPVDGWCVVSEAASISGSGDSTNQVTSDLVFYGKGDPRMR